MARTKSKFILSFIVICSILLCFTINPYVIAFPFPSFNTLGNVLLMHFNNDSSFGENDTHVFDFSGKGNNGTVIGATVTSSGKFNGAFEFDGMSDYINVTDDDSIDFGADENLTISAWVFINSAPLGVTRYNIVSKFGILPSMGYHFDIHSSQRIIIWNADGTFSEDKLSSLVVSLGSWHHVAVVVVRSVEYRYYVDGVEDIKVGDSVVGGLDNSESLFIGKWNTNAQYFNGTIDEVSIWNRTLSSQEIKQLYLEGFCQDTLINNTNCFYTREQYNSPLALSNITYINATIYYKNITVIRD